MERKFREDELAAIVCVFAVEDEFGIQLLFTMTDGMVFGIPLVGDNYQLGQMVDKNSVVIHLNEYKKVSYVTIE